MSDCSNLDREYKARPKACSSSGRAVVVTRGKRRLKIIPSNSIGVEEEEKSYILSLCALNSHEGVFICATEKISITLKEM